MYFGHLHDIVDTTYNAAYMSYWTRHYGELSGEDFTDILDFIAGRADATDGVLPPRIPFAITSNAGADFRADTAAAQLEGTAWIDVREIRMEGSPNPLELTWTDLRNWHTTIPLEAGSNEIVLRAYDYQGQEVADVRIRVTSTAR